MNFLKNSIIEKNKTYNASDLTIIQRASEKKQEEFNHLKKYEKLIKEVEYDYTHVIIPFSLCLSDEIYSKPLLCVNCKNISVEPKMCVGCDALFCNKCIKNFACEIIENLICINCKEKLRFKNLSKIKANLLNNLIISCPSNFDYEEYSLKNQKCCREIVIYRDLLNHMINCKHIEKIVECKNCKFTSKISFVYQHLIELRCNDYLTGTAIYLKKTSESFKKESLVEKKEIEERLEKMIGNQTKERYNDLLRKNERSFQNNLNFEKFDFSNDKANNLENSLEYLRDEIRSGMKEMRILINEKENMINNLSSRISELEKNFEEINLKLNQNELNFESTNKEMNYIIVNSNKNLQDQIDDMKNFNNEKISKINEELTSIKQYQDEKFQEISNCSEIRNKIKLKSLKNYCSYSEKKFYVQKPQSNPYKINSFLSTLSFDNNSTLSSFNFTNGNNHTSDKNIPKLSKFIGHSGNISQIIQIHSKYLEKDFKKTKFTIATSSWDSTIKLWDFDSNNCTATITGHVGAVYCIRQLRDYSSEKEKDCKFHKKYMKTLASCGFDHTIRIWDLKTLKCIRIFHGHQNIVESIVQIKEKLYSCSHDKEIKIWKLKGDEIDEKTEDKLLQGGIDLDLYENYNIYHDVENNPNPNINMNELNKKKELKRMLLDYFNKFYDGNMLGHTDLIKTLQKVKIKGKKYFLISGGHDQTIRIWDIKSKIQEHVLSGHQHCVNTIIKVKWKYDDVTIASGSLDKTVKLWNLETNECFLTINAHDDCVNKLIFLKWKNEENVVISCGDDKSVKFWNIEYDCSKKNFFDAKSFNCLKYNGNAEFVYSLKQMKWGRGETTLLTGGKDNEVTIWN